jgi:hypothetical protein
VTAPESEFGLPVHPDLAREPRAARRREASGLTRAQPWTTPKNQTLSSYSGTTQDDNYIFTRLDRSELLINRISRGARSGLRTTNAAELFGKLRL